VRTLTKKQRISVAIIGCAGVPAQYGGFETLAEQLVYYFRDHAPLVDLTVYCSSATYQTKLETFETAALRYIPLKANGKQSMVYDMWSMIHAVAQGTDAVILLGHGGSFIIPIIKFFSKTKFITNIDGIEWRREKWSSLARAILKKSEAFAIRHSHAIIVDNEAIADYVKENFGRSCVLIPYGGDHALLAKPDPNYTSKLPDSFALALCRIEPENNVHVILEAFAELQTPLVFVGNWDNSDYGRDLKHKYRGHCSITIHDPVYDHGGLRAIRDRASLYVHGHSAGGTNPALVEMMHFGIPVFAYDCSFNRCTAEGKASYFASADELTVAIKALTTAVSLKIGKDMQEIAKRRYTWQEIGDLYNRILDISRAA
jgi:glycosyltransferase involved in cell wall biosynthesis